MRAVVQRVAWAKVSVDGKLVGALDGPGYVVLLGVRNGDGEKEAIALASKLWNLRIMADGEGKMNLSLADTGGGLLVISQFTLYGDTSKLAPSFVDAAPGKVAEPLVARVVEHLRASLGAVVATGSFGAHMLVELANDGPVTVVVES